MEKEVRASIGEKIRRLRTGGNLSIQKLAQKSGVSPAGIYKLEMNEMTPSIVTLMKIAGALGKKASYFIEDVESVRNVDFIKADERKSVYNKESRILIEHIAAKLEDCKLYCGILTVKKGGGTWKETISHAGEEFFFCLGGEIEMMVGEEVYSMKEGDSIHFKAEMPHQWRSRSDGDAKMLYVLTPPSFMPEVDVTS